MGGNLGGTVAPDFTQDAMEVDFVRVYQKNNYIAPQKAATVMSVAAFYSNAFWISELIFINAAANFCLSFGESTMLSNFP